MANYNHVVLAGTMEEHFYNAPKRMTYFSLSIRENNKPDVHVDCEFNGMIHADVSGRDILLHGSLIYPGPEGLEVAVTEWEIV